MVGCNDANVYGICMRGSSCKFGCSFKHISGGAKLKFMRRFIQKKILCHDYQNGYCSNSKSTCSRVHCSAYETKKFEETGFLTNEIWCEAIQKFYSVFANAPEYHNKTPICISYMKQECNKGTCCNNGRHVSLNDFSKELGNLLQGKNADTPTIISNQKNETSSSVSRPITISSVPILPSEVSFKDASTVSLVKAQSEKLLQTPFLSLNTYFKDQKFDVTISSSSEKTPDSQKIPTDLEELKEKNIEIKKMKEKIENLELRCLDLQHQNSQLQAQNVLLNQENIDFKKRILECQMMESEKYRLRTCYNAKYNRETSQQQLDNERHLSHNEFSRQLGNLFQEKNVNISRTSSNGTNISSFEACHFSSSPNSLNQNCTKKESTFDLLGLRPFKLLENASYQNDGKDHGITTKEKSMYDLCFDVLKSGYL